MLQIYLFLLMFLVYKAKADCDLCKNNTNCVYEVNKRLSLDCISNYWFKNTTESNFTTLVTTNIVADPAYYEYEETCFDYSFFTIKSLNYTDSGHLKYFTKKKANSAMFDCQFNIFVYGMCFTKCFT